MEQDHRLTRRNLMRTAGVAGAAALVASASAQQTRPSAKNYRIGVISPSAQGKPQTTNGHTWHFAQYFHPTVNLSAIRKYLDPLSYDLFVQHFRNPKENFDVLPFPDTRLTHIYDADRESASRFAEAFPGVVIAGSPEDLAREVDAVWLGDAIGNGENHFDLVAPALERGLPTFCDKPIGGSVRKTRRILDFADMHHAPLMSSSLFRHQWGTEQALRLNTSGEFGPLQYVVASMQGGFSLSAWLVFGHHPVWMVMTLLGAGVEAVSCYAYGASGHALLTYRDRPPAHVWYGRSDIAQVYGSTSAYFSKRTYEYTPAIEGNYWLGHHYQSYRMAQTFRQMIQTRAEPIPRAEILEVTAVLHAAVRSLNEKNRLVALGEVMDA